MKKLIATIIFFLLAPLCYAAPVAVKLTPEVVEELWSLVSQEMSDPFLIDQSVARRASHEKWQAVITATAGEIDNAVLCSPVLPWTTITGSRVPVSWPDSKYPDTLDEEGNVVEAGLQKRWWHYTRAWVNPERTFGILQFQQNIQNPVIEGYRLVGGGFVEGLPAEGLKRYLLLGPIDGGFLTWSECISQIQVWSEQ